MRFGGKLFACTLTQTIYTAMQTERNIEKDKLYTQGAEGNKIFFSINNSMLELIKDRGLKVEFT